MQSKATSVEQYLEELPEDRKQIMTNLRTFILKNLPEGFAECMSYGMIGYVVPHSIYPAGYHCDPKQPMPYLSLASQKNNISLYIMSIYTSGLGDKYAEEYKARKGKKADMGKGCIRFKKEEDIDFELIGELLRKYSVHEWITEFESKTQTK